MVRQSPNKTILVRRHPCAVVMLQEDHRSLLPGWNLKESEYEILALHRSCHLQWMHRNYFFQVLLSAEIRTLVSQSLQRMSHTALFMIDRQWLGLTKRIAGVSVVGLLELGCASKTCWRIRLFGQVTCRLLLGPVEGDSLYAYRACWLWKAVSKYCSLCSTWASLLWSICDSSWGESGESSVVYRQNSSWFRFRQLSQGCFRLNFSLNNYQSTVTSIYPQYEQNMGSV